MILDIVKIGASLIDKLIPDKKAAAAAKLKLLELDQAGDLKELEAASATIIAEAESEHVLTATWRPITMLTFVVIIANNYIIAPYTAALTGASVSLDIPPEMWNLLAVGLGGYVFGRSAEKSIKAWRNGSSK